MRRTWQFVFPEAVLMEGRPSLEMNETGGCRHPCYDTRPQAADDTSGQLLRPAFQISIASLFFTQSAQFEVVVTTVNFDVRYGTRSHTLVHSSLEATFGFARNIRNAEQRRTAFIHISSLSE